MNLSRVIRLWLAGSHNADLSLADSNTRPHPWEGGAASIQIDGLDMDCGFVIREEFLLPSNPSHTFYHWHSLQILLIRRCSRVFISHVKSLQNDKKLGQVSHLLWDPVSQCGHFYFHSIATRRWWQHVSVSQYEASAGVEVGRGVSPCHMGSPGQWWPHGPCQAGGATHSGVTQPRDDNPLLAPGPGPVPSQADKLENLAAPGRGGSQHCVAHLAPHSSEGWETCAGIELWVTWTKCSLALDKVRTPVSAVWDIETISGGRIKLDIAGVLLAHRVLFAGFILEQNTSNQNIFLENDQYIY